MEVALLGGDRPATTPARAAGLVASVVAVAGCLILALLRPQPDPGSAPILVERSSGGLFVRVGEVVHPVLNLASARLVARTNADPQPVSPAALSRIRLGPLVGIAGAPPSLGVPLDARDAAWTVCESRPGTTVVLGGATTAKPLPVLLVTPSSGGSAYLLYDGRRAVVDPADAVVAHALGLDGRPPVPVSPVLLGLVPESPPIVVPRVPGGGRPGPGSLARFSVGSVLRVAKSGGDEQYVVLSDGVQRVSAVTADLVRGADSRGTRTATPVAPDVITAAPPVTRLPVSDYPRERIGPAPDAESLCARWQPGTTTHPGAVVSLVAVTASAVAAAAQLVQADGRGPAVDAVSVPRGRCAYVRATGLNGSDPSTGTRYLVSENGVRFAVHDAAAARDLGLPDSAIAAPWPVLAHLPAGPELSRAGASVAVDAVVTRAP